MSIQETKYLCFAKGNKLDKELCIPLAEVEVPRKKGTPKSVSVMEEAGRHKGLRMVVCDKDRDCSFYVAENATQEHVDHVIKYGCGSGFPGGYWDSFRCKAKGSFSPKDTVYLVSPDDRVVDATSNPDVLSYMGKGNDLIEKRERALYEMRDRLIDEYGTHVESFVELFSSAPKPVKYKCEEQGLLLLKNGFPMDFTPSMDAIGNMPAQGIERDCAVFYSQMDLVDEDFINDCLGDGPVFVEPKSNFTALYSERLDQVILGGEVFYAIARGEGTTLNAKGLYIDDVYDILRHECYHRASSYKLVRAETYIMFDEAFGLAEKELHKKGVPNSRLDKYYFKTGNKYLYLNAEEVLAYRNCKGFMGNLWRKSLVYHMGIDFPPLTYSYLFDDLEQRTKDEPRLNDEQKESTARNHRYIAEHGELIRLAKEIYNNHYFHALLPPLFFEEEGSNPLSYYLHPLNLLTEGTL